MEYRFEEIDVNIGDLQFRLLQIVNVDEVFDALIAKDSSDPDVLDERIPYWTELWPSSIGMGQYLVENAHLLRSRHVLEIGCGLALPSIVAGQGGASRVTASDYLADALGFVTKNWQLNSPIGSIQLDVQLMDWRTLFLDEKSNFDCDVILASDVVYEKRYADAMIGLINRMPSETKMILSEPGRKVAAEMKSMILANNALKIKQSTIEVLHRGSKFHIEIMEVQRRIL